MKSVRGILVSCMMVGSLQAATTINPVNKYAYGANIGWVNAEGDVANGAVIGEFFSSGYIYGANVGWIHLGDGSPVNGAAYSNSSGTDYGVNTDAAGNLRGFAYGANVGWINFEAIGDPQVDLITGKMTGYAYGANVGWISLSNMQAHVQTDVLDPGPDGDGDGIPDAYELTVTNSTRVLGFTDTDGDGTSDVDEYIAGTDPFDIDSFLAITDHTLDPGLSESDLTWESVLTRLYRVELTTNLVSAASWMDSGLGDISPDAGSQTTRTVPLGGPDQQQYRVKAIQPLSP